MTKYKWQLNPSATLGEIARQGTDPGYERTICGVHRILWVLINVDLNGYIPQEHLDRINIHLERAFTMAKRMDYRLREYHREKHRVEVDSAEFVTKVEFTKKDE
jgi:hypothetical protein